MKLLTLLLLSLVAVASAPALAANGIAFREMHEATTGTTMPATVIYPAAGPAASTELGPYRVAATPGLDIVGGRHPLVLISHGHGGSALGHTTWRPRWPMPVSSSRRSSTPATATATRVASAPNACCWGAPGRCPRCSTCYWPTRSSARTSTQTGSA